MNASSDPQPAFSRLDRILYGLNAHWQIWLGILLGFYALLPFLAPVLMAMGWSMPGRFIYWIYSYLCHQLPERSYFLFGPHISYSLASIHSAWQNTNDIAILRQFIGNAQMGWKVAWSDRMVSMFTSIWFFGLLWGSVKRKIKPLRWWGLVLLWMPAAIDGITHLVSDFAGIGNGFRYSNAWLALWTGNVFPPTFYAGDAWGSFNAWMRLLSGICFGLGAVWYGYPHLARAFENTAEVVRYKYRYRALRLAEKARLQQMAARIESRERSN